MNDFKQLDAQFAAILQNLESSQRRKLAREVSIQLRAAHQKQIYSQRNPDGTRFEPRKLRAKQGSIRRTMFNKVRLSKWLKVESSADKAVVSFKDQVQRIMQVHQEGLRDKVFRDRDLTAKYPKRKTLGFNAQNIEMIRDIVIKHIAAS
ncbi:phage virion morphogenesis protein [Methylophilus sp. 3sh_L]|uniref:phage virion morphogenesis protein n=1 Tax=Methylophilus sp. 3sh_L TaxID=3377114 RepID=UPI00398E7176